MIRLIGCILIASACTSFGFSKAGELGKKLELLEMIYRMLLEVKNMINCSMTIEEIFSHLCSGGEYKKILSFVNSGLLSADFRNDMVQCVQSSRLLNENSKKILKSYISKIGLSDEASQLAYNELACCEIKEQLDILKACVRQKSKLYRSLGILGGALAAGVII